MSESYPSHPESPQQQGISLDELAAAFAKVMDTEPRRPSDTPAPQTADAGPTESSAVVSKDTEIGAEMPGQTPTAVVPDEHVDNVADDVACPISPQSIFEAMLFVGNRDNQPLSPAKAAELMRGVQPDEVPALVDELNKRYVASGCPYEIVGEGNGYRLKLCREFYPLQSRLFGRIREARLSQAAIDVLALVAYQQPITGEKIGCLRSKPSNHILAHLVRRGLLRIERPDPKRRTPHYYTTTRFLRLFNLQSLEDLPRSEDLGSP